MRNDILPFPSIARQPATEGLPLNNRATHIPFYPSDWLAGVAGMTPAQIGVYITVLMLIYDAGGPIVFDKRRLARRMCCPQNTFTTIIEDLIADGKVTLNDGFLSNARAEIELKKLGQKRLLASESAKTRWQEKPIKTTCESMRTHSERNASQNQNQNHILDTDVSITPIIPKVSKPKMIAGKFEEFWSIYPKKQSRGQAESAYAKASKQTDHDEIISGLHRSIQSDHRFQNKQYTPMASTWLNAKGYFDDFSGTNNQTRFNGGSNQHTQSSGSQRQRTGYELAMAAVANLEERERMDGFNPDGRLL